MSAVDTGKADLHKIIDEAKENIKRISKQFCSSMKFTGGIKLNKMHFYLMFETEFLNLIGATTEKPVF